MERHIEAIVFPAAAHRFAQNATAMSRQPQPETNLTVRQVPYATVAAQCFGTNNMMGCRIEESMYKGKTARRRKIIYIAR